MHSQFIRIVVVTTLVCFAVQVKANIHYIDFSLISHDLQLKERFERMVKHVGFYDHWAPQWNHDKSKAELIADLKQSYTEFGNLEKQNTELDLLLGTIAHYLYNLELHEYYDKALDHYLAIIIEDEDDYRAYWFTGTHYAMSNDPVTAIIFFQAARWLLPKEEPTDFWEGFAFATSVANMPSNTIFAMDRIRELSGDAGLFELRLGDVIRNRITSVDKTRNYSKEEIWYVVYDDLINLVCRPLGIKVMADTTWDITVHDYSNGQSALIIKPLPIATDDEAGIGYTIAILMKAASQKDNLDSYINNFISKYPSKEKADFETGYDGAIACKISDSTNYADFGGGRFYIIGVEREAPKYPGLLLEVAMSIPSGSDNAPAFYRPNESKGRFEGRLFYAVILDTCGDIHDESFALFREFFSKNLVIE